MVSYSYKRRTEETALEHGTSKVFHALLKEMMAFLQKGTNNNS